MSGSGGGQIDFAPLLSAVAARLLGDPTRATDTELRYGSRGSLRLDLQRGTWHDFESGTGGGVLDLIAREIGGDRKGAMKWLESEGLTDGAPTAETPKPKQPKRRARIVNEYDYVDEHGEVLFQVVRMEPKDFRQRRPDGNGGWTWTIKGVRQVPYRLPQLLAKPDSTVCVVEGERDVHSLEAMGVLATCNAGGAGKWPDELTPHFTGRNVVVIPDNDGPGRNHAELVASKLHGSAQSVRVLHLPNLPEKGDVTDWIAAGGTKRRLVQLAKQCDPWEPAPEPDSLPEEPPETPEPPDDYEPSVFAVDPAKAPFRVLGYNHMQYYFLPAATQQITHAPGNQLKSWLLTLAPCEWWEAHFPAKAGIDWTAAVNSCIRWAEREGQFDYLRVRGRGAWFDEGRAVLHLGSRLLVDGEKREIPDFTSHYVYEAEARLEGNHDAPPLSAADASQLRMLFSAFLNWRQPLDALLAVGWTVLAPIGGALNWRPHIWITGRRGSGKTWLLENVISPVLGSYAVRVVGATTEAGIRQTLRHDALPVVFDEGEGHNRAALKRMQAVIELARQSSSEGGSSTVKGTTHGKAMTFRIRSMFCIGSINPSVKLAPDTSRFSILELVPPPAGEEGTRRFDALRSAVNDLLTRDYCASMRARMYAMIPTIRANAETFARAAAETLGSQRAGDQLGTLLAGAYACSRDGSVGLDAARRWIDAHKGAAFQEQMEAEATSDERSCLDDILVRQIRLDSGKTLSIGELVEIAAGRTTGDHGLFPSGANDVLRRHGIRVLPEKSIMAVANNHSELQRLLRDTPWEAGWQQLLARLDGAEKSDPVYYSGGITQRSVVLPLDVVLAGTGGSLPLIPPGNSQAHSSHSG